MRQGTTKGRRGTRGEGEPVGNDDSELQHYAKKSPEKLSTETRRLLIEPVKRKGFWDGVRQSELEAETQPLLMEEPVKRKGFWDDVRQSELEAETQPPLMEEPVKRKGFWDGVRQSKLDRRLKALETNEPDSLKKILDVFRADRAAEELRKEALDVEDTLQGVWRTSGSPWTEIGMKQTFKKYIETGAGEVVERIEKKLKSFEGQFPEREAFLERIDDTEATHEVRDKLLEHYDATRSKLDEAAQILQQTKAEIEKLKAKGYDDGMSRRNTNHK
ncbi:hypothetical protein ACQY0O_002411 [Thecaphora frezii]